MEKYVILSTDLRLQIENPWLCLIQKNSSLVHTVWKVSQYGVFSGPYSPLFGLNTEIYGVNLRIQSEYRKIQTRKNYVFGHFSRSVKFSTFISKICKCSKSQNVFGSALHEVFQLREWCSVFLAVYKCCWFCWNSKVAF